MNLYPLDQTSRDRFVLDRRGPRPSPDVWRHQGIIVEDERTADGRIARGATVFLTGRECPWRCVMCDLWQYTIAEDTPRGAIPAQVGAARSELHAESIPVTQIKLYNAGSFFDPRAVPESDYESVAARLDGLARVVVESHPALVGPRVDRFLEALGCRTAPAMVQLEVAMGLETAHPEALARLNKRMTVEDFALAADRLHRLGVSLRAFLLLSPPFVAPGDQDDWLLRSIDVAFSCGASAVSLIPARSGNGALDALGAEGAFRPPRLEDIERSIELALAVHQDRQRIFVDLWDLERFADCAHCFDSRRARLHSINLEQRLLLRPSCAACGCGAAS
ncbi:MAG: radical SAM protein [Vicinamibacterales bacterium]